jgi:hypothetical protein
MLNLCAKDFPIELHNELIDAYYSGIIRRYNCLGAFAIIELDFDVTTEKKHELKKYLETRYKIDSARITMAFNKVEIRI